MAVAMMATTMFVACNDDENNNNSSGDIEVSPTSLNFSRNGGTQTIDVTCSGNWTASYNGGNWLNVNPDRGSGKRTIDVEAGYNSSSNSRNATITFKSGEIMATVFVTQAGASGGGGDGTTPSAPTGVTATAQSANSINVSWNAVSGATSYEVWYEIGWSTDKNQAGSVSSTNYTHTGLQANTTYWYYVKAVNSAGASGYSSAVQATTQSGGETTPAKPSYVNGGITTTTITVNWAISPTPQNVVVEIWRPSSRSWTTLTTLSGSSTSHSISPYRDYIVGGGFLNVGTAYNGPQGISAEADCVFVRIRGKNGSTLGPAKAVMFDAFYRDVYTNLNSVYEN